MKNKNKIIGVTFGLVLLVVVVSFFAFKDQLFPSDSSRTDSARILNPRLVTLDFYNQWLADTKSTTTTPFQSGLINSPVLSSEVRAQIERAQAGRKNADVDPVLCMLKIPNRIISKEIFTQDAKALVLITPRDKDIKTEHQAIVSLTLVANKWLITKIDCTEGEMALEKEFDFEKTGYLLKESIEPPFSKENWHLIYEQEMEPGYVVPLTFNAESVCISTDKTESTCDPTKLTETTQVFIQASMTETGAIVKKMSFQ